LVIERILITTANEKKELGDDEAAYGALLAHKRFAAAGPPSFRVRGLKA
jgi:hypothetical protein